MYVTEAMIASMEDMMRNAGDMEKHIKAMMETEARMHGLELDSRHNARDMWGQLNEHMASHAPATPADPNMHMHDDGMEHSHEGGDMPHTHDDGAPSSVEPAMENTMPPSAPMSEAEQVAEERMAEQNMAQDPNEPKV